MMSRPFLLGCVLSMGMLLAAGTAVAGDADAVTISNAWIRVLPGDLPAGAFADFSNGSDHPVALAGASSVRYGKAMLHRSSTEGGMGRMEMVDRLDIPAHGSAKLSPGAYHVMLMQAKPAVVPGDKVVLTLTFSDGSHKDVTFLARPANAL
jgi:periplasmic copper chaperone A